MADRNWKEREREGEGERNCAKEKLSEDEGAKTFVFIFKLEKRNLL
jgi:hypothetical protein